jgi:hypothetical protein
MAGGIGGGVTVTFGGGGMAIAGELPAFGDASAIDVPPTDDMGLDSTTAGGEATTDAEIFFGAAGTSATAAGKASAFGPDGTAAAPEELNVSSRGCDNPDAGLSSEAVTTAGAAVGEAGAGSDRL